MLDKKTDKLQGVPVVKGPFESKVPKSQGMDNLKSRIPHLEEKKEETENSVACSEDVEDDIDEPVLGNRKITAVPVGMFGSKQG